MKLTVTQLITLDIPFAELKAYPQVIMAIHRKVRPQRPVGQALQRGLTDELWVLLCSCWSDSASQRPQVGEVRQQLEKITM